MSLTPDQKTAVASWVAAGDSLSAVQKKLSEQFQVSLTYRDVRFLVDDLNLELKDAAPKVDTSDVSKTPAPLADTAAPSPHAVPTEKKGFFDKAKEKLGWVPKVGFDELVSMFLSSDEELTWLSLHWEPDDEAAFGGRLTVTREDEGLPVAGVEVSVRWIGVDRTPSVVATQITDQRGIIEVRWPHTPPPGTSVICSAEAGPGGAKLRIDAAIAVEPALGGVRGRPSSV